MATSVRMLLPGGESSRWGLRLDEGSRFLGSSCAPYAHEERAAVERSANIVMADIDMGPSACLFVISSSPLRQSTSLSCSPSFSLSLVVPSFLPSPRLSVVQMASSYSTVVSAYKLPKLTADNFVTWKTYITSALQERELWSYVDGTALAQFTSASATVTSTSTTSETPSRSQAAQAQSLELYNKDRKARAIIVLSASEAMLIHTQPESMSAAETWAKICAACQPKGMATKCSLLRQLWHLRMQEGQRAQDVINQVEAISNKLIGIGEQVPSYHKSIALLGALPPSWEQWAQLMEVHSERPQELEFTNVCNLIIGEEQRRLANHVGHQSEVP